MKKIKIILLLIICAKLSVFAQVTYQNPILRGFYPDPSICKSGDNYYLVTSSFGYFPSVPIFKSKNLVNWVQIGHVLDRPEQVDLKGAMTTLGIFAPTIRCNEGIFYMVTTNITGKGNFFVTTKNPEKGWSNPIFVDMPGIDPSLFFDDNGKVYITSANNWAGHADGILLAELDITTGALLSKPISVWHGTGGRFPEGSHIYKKDGFYYIITAEGGTEYGHLVTIGRSKSIFGPYESNGQNPILTHASENGQFSPIQGVGHADLVQTDKGDWFMVHLGFRPINNHQILGRETFLTPVEWKENEFPSVANKVTSLTMKSAKLPASETIQQLDLSQNDSFDTDKLGFQWNYLHNPIAKNYSLSERKGYLRLYGSKNKISDYDNVTFLGRRQQSHRFTCSTKLEFNPKSEEAEAGIVLYKDAKYHYKVCISKVKGKRVLSLIYQLESISVIQNQISINGNEPVIINIFGDENFYTFYFSQRQLKDKFLGKVENKFLSTETAGGFTGTYIGLYASDKDGLAPNPADFDYFIYQ